jgi:hypothetical protein
MGASGIHILSDGNRNNHPIDEIKCLLPAGSGHCILHVCCLLAEESNQSRASIRQHSVGHQYWLTCLYIYPILTSSMASALALPNTAFKSFESFEASPWKDLRRNPEFGQYIPRYDEQLLGPEINLYIQPPFQISDYVKLETYNCKDCQLRWLVGFEGIRSASSHPLHHTLFQPNSGQTKRCLIVHICGTCIPALDDPSLKSCVAVYFAPRSRYNISKRLYSPILTDLSAAKVAATAALKQVRTEICPQREEELHTIPRSPLNITWQDDGWTTSSCEMLQNFWRFRLLVATESWPLVLFLWAKSAWCINNKMSKNRSHRRDDSVEPETEEDIDKVLLEELDLLARLGIQVQWYCVEKEDNENAVCLAMQKLGIYRSTEPSKAPVAAPEALEAPEGSKDAEGSVDLEELEALKISEAPEEIETPEDPPEGSKDVEGSLDSEERATSFEDLSGGIGREGFRVPKGPGRRRRWW